MEVFDDFPLKDVLFYKIGGRAKYLLKIQSREDLLEACGFIQKNTISNILPIGLGSNLLVSDEGYDGAVLWFAKPQIELISHSSDGLTTVFSSHLLDDVIQYSFKNNLAGLEWAGGLPSTMGAAVRGNVGCFGSEIKDTCVSVEVFEYKNNRIDQKQIDASLLQFSYRNSFIKQNKNLIVSWVVLKLQPTDAKGIEQAKQVYANNIEYRKTHHPIEYPSCGSVFKNIVKKEEVEKILAVWPDVSALAHEKWHRKVAMGYVINRLGFSNLQVGGARVSQKHANYIVNVGDATCKDVMFIIELIQERFTQTFGFIPDLEVEIVR